MKPVQRSRRWNELKITVQVMLEEVVKQLVKVKRVSNCEAMVGEAGDVLKEDH